MKNFNTDKNDDKNKSGFKSDIARRIIAGLLFGAAVIGALWGLSILKNMWEKKRS